MRALVRTTTPPGWGMVPPLRLVPAPRTVKGRPWSLQRRTTRPRASRGAGPHHQGGEHRLQDRGVIGIGEPVGFAHHDLLPAQDLLQFLNQALADHFPSGPTASQGRFGFFPLTYQVKRLAEGKHLSCQGVIKKRDDIRSFRHHGNFAIILSLHAGQHRLSNRCHRLDADIFQC